MARRIPPHLPAVLVLGIAGQIGQILLLRELLMVFHGNEFSIGLILASWLLWVGMGSRLGAALAERTHRPLSLLVLSAAGVLLALPTTILLIRGLRGFVSVLPGTYLSLPDMALSCFLLMAPVCSLLGAQFVLLSRVWRESDRTEGTSSAGKTYAGEAAGNMFGGILFTLLMVQNLNAFQSAVITGTLMIIAHLLLPLKAGAGSWSGGFRPVFLSLLAVAALAFAFSGRLESWAHRLHWRHFMPQLELVEVRQSKHGTIAVLRREDQYSFFQSGHLVMTTAGPKTVAPGLEEQEAAKLAHLAMVQHSEPERVLLIGGGLRGTLSEVLKHPVGRVDYIELDEVLTQIAQPYVSPRTHEALADPRVRLIHTDGRLFVKAGGERYDLVIVDIPDPSTAVLNRYYTIEFFQEVQALLHPDGVLVISAISTPDLRGLAVANRNTMIYHTLRDVFAHVLVAGEGRLFYMATNAPEQISVDAPTLQQRFRERGVQTASFSAYHYQVLLQEAQVRRVNWVVRNHGRSPDAHIEGPGAAPLFPSAIAEQQQAEQLLPPVDRRFFVNSDLRPIGYSYTLMFWDDRARRGDQEAFRWLLHLQSWWLLPPFLLPLLGILGLRIGARRSEKRSDVRLAVLLAVFTTGLSAMALQIAMLFSFQSVYGFVYEMVGLIMAIFMGGLALGTFLVHRYVANKANLRTLAVVQLLMALLAILMAVVVPRSAAVPSPETVFLLFSTLTFATGLINGLSFPLAAACFMSLDGRPERSAGAVYSVELLGACLGAVLASVVLVPIVGVVVCCLFAAMVNVAAFAGLVVSRRSYA